MTESETATRDTAKNRKLGPPKRVALPRKERGLDAPKKSSIIGPWLGILAVLLVLGLLALEDAHYRQERASMLQLVEEWATLGQSASNGRASVNASKSMDYRQALMMGQGFLRSSRLQPENREASLSMALFHFRVALKQLPEDDSLNERARLKLLSRIAEIEKALEAEFGVQGPMDLEGKPLEGESSEKGPEVAP